MSSEATRSYKAGHVRLLYEGATYRIGTEDLIAAVQQDGDGLYFGFSSPSFAQVGFKPFLDGLIPTGAELSEINISIRTALGQEDGQTVVPDVGAAIKGIAPEGYPLDPPLPGGQTIVFPVFVPFDARGEIKDDYWLVASNPFSVNLPTLEQLNQGVFEFGLVFTDVVPTGILYVDEVDFDITFTLTPSNPQDLSVYDVTPYSAKVLTLVATEQCINASYPMDVWFEWTSVDPTNDDGLLFIQTTPEQTFTSDPNLWPEGRPGQFNVYDTLPSPLDVQNPRSRLLPNTTYWVRAACRVNGETLYSAAWTSFTTPENDKVTL